MSTEDDRHFRRSSYREKVVEHLFVGELLRYLWAKRAEAVDILKPEVDNGGYDIVVTHGKTVRHIQLKASLVNGSAASQNINASLGEHPSGCVIWILIDEHLNFEGFLWFGSQPGEPLPDLSERKQAKHTRGNAQGIKPIRTNTKVIPKSAFERVASFAELSERLFGAEAL